MMNENSPICAIENPGNAWPTSTTGLDKKAECSEDSLPHKYRHNKLIYRQAYCTSMAGSTNMPTDTKKMAEKVLDGESLRAFYLVGLNGLGKDGTHEQTHRKHC